MGYKMEKECKVNKDWDYTIWYSHAHKCWVGSSSMGISEHYLETLADTPEQALLRIMHIVQEDLFDMSHRRRSEIEGV